MSSDKAHVRKAVRVGTNSIVIAIAPPLVQRFEIDDSTYFEETETADGILLRPKRLT